MHTTDPKSDPATRQPSDATASSLEATRQDRILVVDDEKRLRETVATLLRLAGYEVETAEHGVDGVEKARRQPPDVIVCDVTMPELDGHGVLKAVRAEERLSETPFIFLTANGEARDVRAGMNIGADDYLIKPVVKEDLLSAVRVRLDRRKASEARARQRLESAPFTPDFSSAAPLLQLGLTERESEVLLWVAQGKSNPEIGVILGMSDKTVKKHLQNLFPKIGVENRNAATLLALDRLGRSAGA